MNNITATIRELAATLLDNGTVDAVIGFKAGSIPMSAAPVIIRTAEQAQDLIWDSNCRLNLANYLAGRKEKLGIIAKGCDSRNIVSHIVENKIDRDQLYIIGVPCTGMVDKALVAARVSDEITAFSETDDAIVINTQYETITLNKNEFLRSNCTLCTHRNPVIHDQLAADLVAEPEIENRFSDVDKIEALDRDKKWQLFDDLYENCIRCYACRNACPLCFCPTCFVDESNPQWVGKGQDATDIRTFHFLRAYHCAGRCTDCGACVEACPMDIDVRAFTRKLNKDVFQLYGWQAGLDTEKRPPLDTFNPIDSNEYIK